MRRHRSHWPAIAIALAAATAALVAAAIVPLATAGAAGSGHPVAARVVTIGRPEPIRPIGSGFLGLSFEYSAIEPYAGTDPRGVNPVLLQLMRNLTPGQAPVIRIGGESTDWAWWPAPHIRKPAGVNLTLTARLSRLTGGVSPDGRPGAPRTFFRRRVGVPGVK